MTVGYGCFLSRSRVELCNCSQESACSTEGISFMSVVTEVSCYAAMAAYAIRQGYAPTIWGCEAACWVQDMTLVGMPLTVSKRNEMSENAMEAMYSLPAHAIGSGIVVHHLLRQHSVLNLRAMITV
jgi:hypothetical protein